MKKETKKISIDLNISMLQKLDELAKNSERSRNQYIRYLLMNAIESCSK